MLASAHVLVMAKDPQPGAVKTRLTARYTADAAAACARAALLDTLDAVRTCAATRRVLALDGDPSGWLDQGCAVIAQRGATFNARLGAAWEDAGAPGLQIGMDTPHVTPALLDDALMQLAGARVDAVLGLATDGGWWAIGFRRPVPGAFDGVVMSASDTGAQQLHRLRTLGLRVTLLAELRDIDHPADLEAIADAYPGLRVARVARELAGVAP